MTDKMSDELKDARKTIRLQRARISRLEAENKDLVKTMWKHRDKGLRDEARIADLEAALHNCPGFSYERHFTVTGNKPTYGQLEAELKTVYEARDHYRKLAIKNGRDANDLEAKLKEKDELISKVIEEADECCQREWSNDCSTVDPLRKDAPRDPPLGDEETERVLAQEQKPKPTEAKPSEYPYGTLNGDTPIKKPKPEAKPSDDNPDCFGSGWCRTEPCKVMKECHAVVDKKPKPDYGAEQMAELEELDRKPKPDKKVK